MKIIRQLKCIFGFHDWEFLPVLEVVYLLVAPFSEKNGSVLKTDYVAHRKCKECKKDEIFRSGLMKWVNFDD